MARLIAKILLAIGLDKAQSSHNLEFRILFDFAIKP
ncbi:hypothetical protein BQ8482_280045 [Mesorhizobium delmotii]|uniref:Uncharacterized protein n=1 Tax=Mesorhizobium delmotii TaxID=1631247 RepID=A0A2P9AME8_9HYPH|nr:hypothetical protein BQ8482_280045 [Mesorhizobium delmotii]